MCVCVCVVEHLAREQLGENLIEILNLGSSGGQTDRALGCFVCSNSTSVLDGSAANKVRRTSRIAGAHPLWPGRYCFGSAFSERGAPRKL